MKMDWLKIWHEDKECIINTMRRNMADDLKAGYDYNGVSIQRQIKEIKEYEQSFKDDLIKLAEMPDNKIQKWCYFQLLKSGAISL